MKPKLAGFFFLAASSIMAGPIAVTGSGTFGSSFPDTFWNLSFSGGSGSTLTFGNFTGTFGSPLTGGLGGSNLYGGPTIIDGLYFAPGFATFAIGNEGGSITGYDGQHRLIITQDLISGITITSYSCFGIAAVQDCQGAFQIHAPEPGTWMLLGLGLAAMAGVARTKRRATVKS